MDTAPEKAAAPTAAPTAAPEKKWAMTPGAVIDPDMLDNATDEELQEAYDCGMYESAAEQAFFEMLGKPVEILKTASDKSA